MNMKRFKITEKLNNEILTDIKFALQNQIKKNFDEFDWNTIKLLHSDFRGDYIQVKNSQNKEVDIFNYYKEDDLILIRENFNEFRIFDLLEDAFGKDIIDNGQNSTTPQTKVRRHKRNLY